MSASRSGPRALPSTAARPIRTTRPITALRAITGGTITTTGTAGTAGAAGRRQRHPRRNTPGARPGGFPLRRLQPGNAHRGAEAVGAIERVAVFAVHRGVMGAGEQQPVLVPALVLAPVLEQDLADLLVVGIVAHARRQQGEAANQRLAVGKAVEIGTRPVDAVRPVEGENGGVDAGENLVLRQSVGAARRAHRNRLGIADPLL